MEEVPRSVRPGRKSPFLLPSIAYGIAAGAVRSHRDIVTCMTKSMESMSNYLVLVFFMALIIAAFNWVLILGTLRVTRVEGGAH